MKYVAGLLAFALVTPVWAADVTAKQLIEWFNKNAVEANCVVKASGIAGKGNPGFCPQCSDDNSMPVYKGDGAKRVVSLWTTGSTSNGSAFFKADMSVDCDGSNNGSCKVSNDPSHQEELSCDCDADAGEIPFFVIPMEDDKSGEDQFDYTRRGIKLGQVGVVINTKNNKMCYATFLDEDGVSQEIGEVSAALADSLGVNPNPDTGGDEDISFIYIVFTGDAGRLSSKLDMANHAKAVALGKIRAAALVGTPINPDLHGPLMSTALNSCRLTSKTLFVNAEGRYGVTLVSLKGQTITKFAGSGPQNFTLPHTVRPGFYLVRINSTTGVYGDKILVE